MNNLSNHSQNTVYQVKQGGQIYNQSNSSSTDQRTSNLSIGSITSNFSQLSIQQVKKINKPSRYDFINEDSDENVNIGEIDVNSNITTNATSPNTIQLINEIGVEIIEQMHENGKLKSRISYKNNLKHGLKEKWHDNEQIIQKTTYKDGKKHGLSEKWKDNEQIISKTTYKNGKKHGFEEVWYPCPKNEQTTKIAIMYRRMNKNGIQHGIRKDFDQDGILDMQSTYINGIQEGLCQYFGNNGSEQGIWVSCTEYYLNGMREGYRHSWDENQNLIVRINFVKGREQGLWEQWDENQNLILSNYYIDGQPHKTFKRIFSKTCYTLQQYDKGKLIVYQGQSFVNDIQVTICQICQQDAKCPYIPAACYHVYCKECVIKAYKEKINISCYICQFYDLYDEEHIDHNLYY